MDYSHPPRKSGLPREVLKWLQGLHLSISPRNVRRDFANGRIVAEIFSLHYPEDCSMHSFINGTSLTAKLGNWSQIERFLQKQNLQLTKEAVEGTIHCKPGAAEVLVQDVYGLLTNHRIKSLQDTEFDFSDRRYQNQLPVVARSTASTAVKNNLSLSELTAEPDIRTNQRKVWDIIHKHLEQRATERLHNPGRFRVRSSHARRQTTANMSTFPPVTRQNCGGPYRPETIFPSRRSRFDGRPDDPWFTI